MPSAAGSRFRSTRRAPSYLTASAVVSALQAAVRRRICVPLDEPMFEKLLRMLCAAQRRCDTRRSGGRVTYEVASNASNTGGMIQTWAPSPETYAEMKAMTHAKVAPA